MCSQITRAAQYIRMSTDRQDLSPLVQKDAIAAFSQANGFEIVRSYEDEGKSGLELANRPKLRELLKDVADSKTYSAILVYDVSRWGRFQDADASAYYEYHCRLNGVQVIYVSESFANDQTPATVLLKSMRRVMAAEYSRDIAFKSRAGQERVVSMGFQMGPLPAFAYRRCSVSADGLRRLVLQHGQRKAALTDRIEWVLGPDAEVDLVRRACAACASGVPFEAITGLVNAEGWRTDKGRALTTEGLKRLLGNEALIGNFVWGVKSKGGKVIQCSPTRRNGSVPRIIDDTTWALIQARLKGTADAESRRRSDACSKPMACQNARRPRQLRLAFDSSASQPSYRRTLGSAQQLRDQTRKFGRALCTEMLAAGLHAAFDPRTHVLSFWTARVRVRLMWPIDPTTWALDGSRSLSNVENLLLARMNCRYCPLDFFLLPAREIALALARPLPRDVPRELRPYWCTTAEEVMCRLSAVCAGASISGRDRSVPRSTGRQRPAGQRQPTVDSERSGKPRASAVIRALRR